MWRQQNHVVFNNMQWPIEKTRQVIWDALHDYDMIESKHSQGFGKCPGCGLLKHS